MILCIGEAMVELSGADGPGLWRMGFAGDTLNTAWYLRRLLGHQWRVGYFSRVGNGEFSRELLDFMQTEGIETDLVSRDPLREVGLYAISLKDGERSFSYWRDSSAARGLADDPDSLDAALAACGTAYFSGITMAILPDAGRRNLLKALDRARASQCRIVFDPNLRPRLWTDAAPMRRWVEDAAARADLVLPSLEDEMTHFGDADAHVTAERYLRLGAGQVIIKNGDGPVSFAGAAGAGVICDLPRVTPVDTTSAGDSFNAGYLAAALNGADPATAIRKAHDLSRRVILHHGALVREAVRSA
nr:sugar kinase [Paracoccus salsus]